MMTPIIIAIVALIGAIASSLTAIYVHRKRERADVARRLRNYNEPLISSAYDLQARIYSILRKDFLAYVRDDRWGRGGTALETTLFAFAQYFGWREILRREIELLEFETRDIGRILSAITGTFGSDGFGPKFLLWKPEQRAIGEGMIGEWYGEPSCVGYLEFCKRRRGELGKWLEPLERDLRELAERPGGGDARLTEVQHKLTDLVAALDLHNRRYAPERLERA